MLTAPEKPAAKTRGGRAACARAMWRPHGTDETVILSEIGAAGYAGVPWIIGDTSRDLAPDAAAEQIARTFADHGLVAAPGYLWTDFWLTDYTEDIAWAAAVSRHLGLDTLLVSAGGFDTVMPSGRKRRDVPGRVAPEDGLTAEQRDVFLRNLDAAGRAALGEGVKLAYHPHVGTVVESPDEVEWLVTNTDPEVVFLGPDTGHLRWAGLEVEPFFERHASRISAWHAKDVNLDVVARATANGWEYDHAVGHGLFTEIGAGNIDFEKVCSVLDAAGFNGWVIAETDLTLLETPAESARQSRVALKELGF